MATADWKAKRERAFDWEGAHQRIAAAQAAQAGPNVTAPEVLEQIWAERAARLSQAFIQEDKGEQIELLLIKLGRGTYGLDARCVLTIKPANQITHVPRVPDWVTGVVNIRGHILSVLDLQRFFGLPSAEGYKPNDLEPVEKTPFLIVVETPSMEIALLADDVLMVETMPADRVQDATGAIQSIPPEYVRGVVEHNPGGAAPNTDNPVLVLVLDLPALLADERLIVHEEIT
ncbi:MAG: hypothetical protein DRJ03_05865 [Chloroflexi bacterium]|nr:MAG: hypothetical protein B6I35_02370 [Anaerolineaceae bacterium 4572_32.2]RLC81764.1 MAG: hypothetical protein DRI81_01625 [Chloroflexota bacterium]RLC87489.1 MAG: hypothetical protein DRJ03_05865 [Chloroflexota bacterium]HEY74459.1 purine-binding chemotaxis protein CheW [Thermoflexia bacterium]